MNSEVVIRPYLDSDFDWFEKIVPGILDPNNVSANHNNLFTVSYGDFGRALFRLYGNRCNIGLIATKKEHRKTGIAKKILQELINYCKSNEKDILLITSGTSFDNVASLNLHKSVGFSLSHDHIMKRYRFYLILH